MKREIEIGGVYRIREDPKATDALPVTELSIVRVESTDNNVSFPYKCTLLFGEKKTVEADLHFSAQELEPLNEQER